MNAGVRPAWLDCLRPPVRIARRFSRCGQLTNSAQRARW